MKATELRISNLVSHIEESNVLVIDSINRESVWVNESPDYHYEMDIELISPIPLTEEWLIKLGFTKDNYHFVLNDKCSVTYEKTGSEKGFWYSNDDTDAYCYRLKEIKYVHDLQNLYFALYGEELKF